MNALNCDYNDLYEDFDTIKIKNSLVESVRVAIMDPRYGTRRERGARNSDHEVLTPQDMDNTVELLNTLVRPGEYIYMFCTEENFGEWKASLEKATMVINGNRRIPMWTITKTSFKLICKPNHVNHSPINQVTFVDGMEFAIHAKRNGQSYQ